MPTISIRITTETRKELEQTLSRAFKAGDLGMIKRATALLGIARGEAVALIATGVGVSPSTVYAWLRAFLLEGVAGRAELNQDDMIHPTAAGQQRVAETVWRVLEGVLRGHGSSS